MSMRITRGIFSLLFMMLGSSAAYAQASATGAGPAFPSKPVRMVSPEAGGAGDFAARLIAQALPGYLGQQLVIDNRAQIVAAEVVMKAPPDGYTLLLGSGSFFLGPLLRETQYDPVRDFTPITLATSAPAILVVHPSLPVQSVKDLIALARANPGKLNYGSGASGGGTHLAAELLKSMAKVNIVRIPHKGDGPVTISLLTGQIQLAFINMGSVLPHAKSGKLKALGIASAQPSLLLPGVPTVASGGLPGFTSGSLTVIVAPIKTPAAIVGRLNQDIVQVLHRADVKEKFATTGVEVVASSPDQLAATMKSEIATAARIVRDADIRPD